LQRQVLTRLAPAAIFWNQSLCKPWGAQMRRLGLAAVLAISLSGTARAGLNEAELCQAHISVGAWNAAVVSCTNAIDSGQYNGAALALLHATRADALVQQADTNEALDDYAKAIELNPSAAAPYFARGGVFLRQGHSAKAAADFRAAIRLRPQNLYAHFGLGSALAQAKDWRGAVTALTDTIALRKDFGVAYRLRAEAFAALGDAKAAESDRAMAKKLGVAEIKRNPLPVKLDDDDAPEIEAPPASRASGNAPVDKFVLDALAECAKANANKDWDQAVATCTRAIDSRQLTGVRLAGAYADRAIAYDEAMRPDQAMADYAKALSIDPGNPVFLANRAVSRAKDGEIQKAMADFDAAIAKRPSFGYAYAMRGLTFLATGDEAKAKADMRKAYDLGERHPVLVEKMQALGLKTP
jgi:tetratricopeptide (TPR) repeat protein